MKTSSDSANDSNSSPSSYVSNSYRKGWEERRRTAQNQEIEEQKRILKAKERVVTDFLNTHPPSRIQAELNEYIMDQVQLTKVVSDFLYYQALRYKYPDLPARPLLICGPSGSGKTEVWRVAKRLYSDVFKITFINAANITSDGWSGSNKISNYITFSASDSILILDEADKLFSPRYTVGNVNTSASLQAEFLKLIEENEYVVKAKNDIEYTVRNLGVVFVGAFESIREEKAQTDNHSIGFGSQNPVQKKHTGITRKDLLEYGVISELLGRISVICNTKPMTKQQCIKIVKNKSRLTVIADILAKHGIDAWKNLPDERILQMVDASNLEKFGVRSVLSKIETIMLDSIRKDGLVHPIEDELKNPEMSDNSPTLG